MRILNKLILTELNKELKHLEDLRHNDYGNKE